MRKIISCTLLFVILFTMPVNAKNIVNASKTIDKAAKIKIGKNVIKVNNKQNGYWFKFTAKEDGIYSFLFNDLRGLNKTSEKSDLICIIAGDEFRSIDKIVWDNAHYDENGECVTLIVSKGCSHSESTIQYYKAGVKQRGEIELTEGETCYFILTVCNKKATRSVKGKITCKVTMLNY